MTNPFRTFKGSAVQTDQLPDVGEIYDKLLATKTLGEILKVIPDIKKLKGLDPVSFLHLTIVSQLQELRIRVIALENANDKRIGGSR
jgi:hypothetical protein